MRKLPLTLTVGLVLALVGCGSSSPSAQTTHLRGQVITRCIADGSSRTSCVCTLDRATAAGMDMGAIMREEGNGAVATDPRLLNAAVSCVGK